MIDLELQAMRTLWTRCYCRLCWKITLAVFGLILSVECVILVPSAARFRQVETGRLAAIAGTAVESLLALDGPVPDPRRIQQGFAALAGRMNVAGLQASLADGTVLASAGEPVHAAAAPRLPLLGAEPEAIWHSEDRSRCEFAWRTAPGSHAMTLIARMDSSYIADELRAYVLRIAGLVALVVLVVTTGTMVVLHFSVLGPLLRLRDGMIRAGEQPDIAERFAVAPGRRNDELGEAILAHNAMLVRIAESKRRDARIAEERARYATRHDALTGLPNREALLEFLERRSAVSGRSQRAALFLINIVGFRLINTRFGAAAGNALLVAFAARLKARISPDTFLARIGADRFAAVRIGPGSPMEAAALAEQIESDAAGGITAGGHDITVAIHIGIAHEIEESADGQTLLSQADIALDRLRAGGAGPYQFFLPSMAEEAHTRQRLARDLRRAPGDGGLSLVYQPKVMLGEQDETPLSGVEALLRWRHPQEGLIGPDVFIPIAESSGVILALGDFVLKTACAQIREWIGRFGWSPRVAVNLSARQFSDPGLVQGIRAALSAAEVPAELIEIEITETAAMTDAGKTADVLRELRGLGLRISIDDFGTGYSSLAYLRRFQVDSIKLDKSFVEDIGRDRHAEAVCSAVLRLGQALGTRIVAEGIETEEQLDFLRCRKCDEGQGYLFSKPLSPGELESAYLREHSEAT